MPSRTPVPDSGEIRHFVIGDDAAGQRLDRWLAAANPDMSRSRIRQLIDDGHVTLAQDKAPTAATRLKAGQRATLRLPAPAPTALPAQARALDIVYEDDVLVVVDKPAGLVVHPAAGNPDGTLVNALLAHCGDSLRGIGGKLRPGIVHRIDKDTSGLLVAAKTAAAHAHLAQQFARHTIARVYDALVWGVPTPRHGVIAGQIGRSTTDRKKMAVRKTGGKYAETHYRTLEAFGTVAAWVQCELKTGRTHQIRVHMASRGHALVGDPAYGTRRTTRGLDAGAATTLRAFPRQALHARVLGFTHPTTGRMLRFERDPPQDFQDLARLLRLATRP
jgi:23S rRNA pseudouridine1911/1915/1917 synthase